MPGAVTLRMGAVNMSVAKYLVLQSASVLQDHNLKKTIGAAPNLVTPVPAVNTVPKFQIHRGSSAYVLRAIQ